MKFQIGTTEDGAPIYEDMLGRVTYGCAPYPIIDSRVLQSETGTATD